MITATRHPFAIGRTFTKEESSAVSMLELVPSAEGNDCYDALVTYHSSDKVYRYEVEVSYLVFHVFQFVLYLNSSVVSHRQR